MKKSKICLISAAASVMTFMNFFALNSYADGDVASAVTSTWNSAKGQIKSIAPPINS